MTPPPGWVEEPHIHRSAIGERYCAAPGTGRLNSSWSKVSSPWKMLPSVRPTSFSSSRGVRTSACRIRSLKPGRVVARSGRCTVSPKASRSASVHSPPSIFGGQYCTKHAHEMLARRRHGRIDEGRDHHVEEGIARPAAGLPVVVGPLHPLDRVGEVQVAPQAGRVLGQRREARQAVERDVDLAGGAADLEVRAPA